MTNFEIVLREAIMQKVFTPEQVALYVENGLRIPLHTFQEWHNLGYMVKKGEKSRMTCMIWKYSSKNVPTEDGQEEEKGGRYFLAKAHFFTADQVEKIKEEATV